MLNISKTLDHQITYADKGKFNEKRLTIWHKDFEKEADKRVTELESVIKSQQDVIKKLSQQVKMKAEERKRKREEKTRHDEEEEMRKLEELTRPDKSSTKKTN